MGYTSGAAMDQRGLRDVERWRDKIEVRLDNRQVFFLFFGSALVACLLFVLGVVVGKRLESRGRAVAPEVEDPLALLDKVATTPRPTQTPALTFPQALFGSKNAQNGAKKTDLRLLESKTTDANRSESSKVAEAGKPTTKNSEPTQMALAAPDKASSKASGKLPKLLDSKPAESTKASEPKSAPGTEESVAKAAPAPKPASASPALSKAVAASVPAAQQTAGTAAALPKNAPVPVIGAAATDSAKGRAHFTLQLSSFQDRSEAEAFAAKFGSEKTYLVVSEIPGKGTWYRVRAGDFATAKDAIAGKLAFEKKHGVIAYVAQR
ncbi:MAG: SPOR domain-containing protein [Polyangia bacterium]